jgi:hypothetical protein
MGNTYTLFWHEDGLVNREVRICSQKFVADNCTCGDDPRVIPVGVTEVLKLVSWV